VGELSILWKGGGGEKEQFFLLLGGETVLPVKAWLLGRGTLQNPYHFLVLSLSFVILSRIPRARSKGKGVGGVGEKTCGQGFCK